MSLRFRRPGTLRVAVLLGLLLFPAHPVRAADREQEARTLFDAGVKSYEEEHFDDALTAFQEAYRLTQRPGLLFSIAQALRRLYETTHEPDRLREAIRYYERYLSTHPKGDHRAEAASWLEQLGSLPEGGATVTSQIGGDARTQLVVAVNVKSARVTLDGQPVPSLPYAAQVTAGKHHVAVTADGYAPYERDVEVEPNAVVPLDIELQRATSRLEIAGNPGAEVVLDGASLGVLPVSGFDAAPGRHELEVRQVGHFTLRQTVALGTDAPLRLRLVGAPTTRRLASWGFVGGGAAALATGGVLTYLALQKQGDARALQDQPGMGPAFDDAVAARNGLRLGAVLTASAGVVAVVGGAVSLATEGFGPPRPAARSVGVLRYDVSPLGVGVSGAF